MGYWSLIETHSQVYADTLPPSAAQVLSRNIAPLPSVGATFAEEAVHLRMKAQELHQNTQDLMLLSCADLSSLGRFVHKEFPKSHGPLSKVKEALLNPLVAQIIIYRPIMMPVFELAIGPVVWQITREKCSYKAAHVWLAIETLSEVRVPGYW
jgi:hypothetical protein